MNDISQIVRAPVPGTIAPKPKGYQASNEVKLRANVSTAGETPEEILAARKLNRELTSSEPPRQDVPRGFYLDIVV
jgi:hypothetical protein